MARPVRLNSWLAVKEAANREEKNKKNLKKGRPERVISYRTGITDNPALHDQIR
jgi:hypothetical protein